MIRRIFEKVALLIPARMSYSDPSQSIFSRWTHEMPSRLTKSSTEMVWTDSYSSLFAGPYAMRFCGLAPFGIATTSSDLDVTECCGGTIIFGSPFRLFFSTVWRKLGVLV